jgi:formaldehyde-activating enzyme involved in methanogenesis
VAAFQASLTFPDVGTETFFSSLTASLQTSPLALSVLTSSIEVYRLAAKVREEVAKSLEVGKEVVRVRWPSFRAFPPFSLDSPV